MSKKAEVVSVLDNPTEHRMNDHTWWTVPVLAKIDGDMFRKDVICHSYKSALDIRSGHTWQVD